MKGTVIKRGSKWSVVIDLGRDPVTKKRRRSWHSGFDRKRDAEAARVEILARLQRGSYVEPSRTTLGEFLLTEWLPTVRATLEPNSWATARNYLTAYVIPHLGSRPLQELTPAEINLVYAGLLEGGRRDGAGLAPQTVKNTHSVLHKALSDAVRWDLIVRNPADRADPPSVGRSAKKTWTPEQLRAFFEGVRGDRLFGAYVVAASTGLRRSELLALPWVNVDLDRGRLQVTQKLIKADGELTLRPRTKTASSRRSVALDSHLVAILREHRRRQLEERLAWGKAYRDTGLVFTREDGSPIRPDALSESFARYVRELGLPRIPLKNLRHTHATLALQAGVHPKVVQERLGHSSISITLDTYSEVVPSMEEEAAERVAGLVFGR